MTERDPLPRREQLQAAIREAGGTLIPGPGTFAVLPSSAWDPQDLPDADPSRCLVPSADGEPTLAVPAARPRYLRGGVHVVAPEHVAALWEELPREALVTEYEHRCAEGMPVPPILEATMNTGGVV